MIYIESKRRKRENIEKQYPNAIIWDITSTSENEEARKLSPFYPHGGVHIPSFSGMTATCVEAVWQGLKVFENSDIDVETFKNDVFLFCFFCNLRHKVFNRRNIFQNPFIGRNVDLLSCLDII